MASVATSARLAPTGRATRPSTVATTNSSRYPVVMRRRGGSRSASDPSRVPPTTWGRKPTPNVTAVSSGEPVTVKTSTDNARMRRVSAAMATDLVTKSTRKTGSAKTWP